MPTLTDAVEYIRMGDREQGRQILEDLLETDENNEDVWLWLCTVVDNDEDRGICLENVLALNPDNDVARRAMAALQAGTFNQNDLLSDLIELEEESQPETTFTDDFVVGGDDELALPSTMAKSKPKAKSRKKKSGFALNMRMIVLAVLILVVVLVLGGVAAFSLLSGGLDGGDDVTPPGQVDTTPADQQSQEAAPEPTATPTLIPTATDMPTPTRTPFQLPTARPPDAPTPTATRVVSPTPAR